MGKEKTMIMELQSNGFGLDYFLKPNNTMEAIKTPNDMSDKAKEFLKQRYSQFNSWSYYPPSESTVSELMQSYAEQHLEDVLEKAEKEIDSLYQPSGMHEFYTAGFEEGAKWLLNLLKQGKG